MQMCLTNQQPQSAQVHDGMTIMASDCCTYTRLEPFQVMSIPTRTRSRGGNSRSIHLHWTLNQSNDNTLQPPCCILAIRLTAIVVLCCEQDMYYALRHTIGDKYCAAWGGWSANSWYSTYTFILAFIHNQCLLHSHLNNCMYYCTIYCLNVSHVSSHHSCCLAGLTRLFHLLTSS